MAKTYLVNSKEVTYRDLQAMAKELGIKANKKGEVLAMLINQLTTNEETIEVDVEDEYRKIMNEDPQLESASEASAPIMTSKMEVVIDSEPKASVQPPIPETTMKLFTFVRADNCIVVFKQKNQEIKIGWSQKDYRCYIVKDNTAKLYSVNSAINAFKKYVDKRDGDIRRIVHALVRIRTKPSMIHAMENHRLAQRQENVSPVESKENQSTSNQRRKYDRIDPTWLQQYMEDQGEDFDAKKVRQAYEEHLLSVRC